MHAEGGRSRWTLKILPCFRPEEDLIERLREKKSSEEGERDLENRSTLRDCIRSDSNRRDGSVKEMDAWRIGVIGGMNHGWKRTTTTLEARYQDPEFFRLS